MAHKEQHHNRRNQKKPKKSAHPEQVTQRHTSFIQQINDNEVPQTKP